MPYTLATFANVSGASNAVAGQIVQSAVWDNIHIDYSAAFTQVMSQLVATITNRNICWMNGGFDIWQRAAGGSGASVAVGASSTAYTADRWYLTTGANQAFTVLSLAGLSSKSLLSASIGRNVGQTGVGAMVFGYPLDSEEVQRMLGSKVTLSFLVKAGANFSPTNGTLTASLYVGTGTPGKRGGGFTGETQVLTVATNITGTTASVSVTSSAIVPVTSTQGEIQFTWTPVGTAGAADSFQVDDLQIENNLTSTTWTPMNFDVIPWSEALMGCKRHYQKTQSYTVAPGPGTGFSNALQLMSQAVARFGIWWQLPVEMRGIPTFTKSHPTTATASSWVILATIAGASSSLTASIDTVNNTSAQKGIFIYGATNAADQVAFIHMQADAGL